MGASHEKLETTTEAYPESMEASLEKLEVNQEKAEITALCLEAMHLLAAKQGWDSNVQGTPKGPLFKER
jgi:methionyl-tRNA synthetase